MKTQYSKFIILLITIFNLGYAQEQDLELIQTDELLTMEEVKEINKKLNPDESCIDEYLKRRKQLITSLVLTPVTGAVTIGASAIGGVYIGSALGSFDHRNNGWAQLGWAIGGGMLGTAASVSYVIVDTTLASIQLAQVQTIAKSLAEIHADHQLISTKKLYRKIHKVDDVSEEDLTQFALKIKELDSSQKLCDGSLLPSKKYEWQRKRLKNKIARYKHIRPQFLNI